MLFSVCCVCCVWVGMGWLLIFWWVYLHRLIVLWSIVCLVGRNSVVANYFILCVLFRLVCLIGWVLFMPILVLVGLCVCLVCWAFALRVLLVYLFACVWIVYCRGYLWWFCCVVCLGGFDLRCYCGCFDFAILWRVLFIVRLTVVLCLLIIVCVIVCWLGWLFGCWLVYYVVWFVLFVMSWVFCVKLVTLFVVLFIV